jgi:hypothetical protein
MHCAAQQFAIASHMQEVNMQHWVSVVTGTAQFDSQTPRASRPAFLPGPRRARARPPEGDLPQQRAAALRNFFPKIATWFETAIDRAQRREVEAFLAHATDIADLEQRIREVERRTIVSRRY